MRHTLCIAVASFLISPVLLGAQNPPPAKASISGVVVRLGTSEPVRRAQVTLIRVADSAQPAAMPQQLPQSPFGTPAATTDDRGKFEFKDIDPGAYRVAATRNGFIKQEYGQRSPNRPGSVLSLRAGERLQDIMLVLTPAATLTGRVIDGATGEPLAGITIQAMRSTYDASGKRTLQAAASDRTNDLGEYRLYWINPGHYYVSANSARSGFDALSGFMSQAATISPPQNPSDSQAAQAASLFGAPGRSTNEVVDSGFVLTYYPGTPDVSRAIPIELQAGSEMRADFNLTKGEKYRIRGRLIDSATGKPPDGAEVTVVPRNGAGSSGFDALFGGLSSMLNKSTDYNSRTGEFEIREVASGAYWLTAMFGSPQAGGMTTFTVAPGNPFPDLGFNTTQMALDVFDRDLENVTLVARPSVSVSGRIRMEGAADPKNALGFISVSLQSTTGGSFLTTLAGTASPAPDGTFKIPRLAPGEYKLVINGLNPSTYVKSARLDQADVLQGFTLGDRIDGSLEIVLSPNVGQLDGTVIGADQKPVSGVQAVLIPERQRGRLDLYKAAVTNADGRFTIRGITPGDYRVFAWEEIEPFSYFDPEVLKQSETQGKLVRIGESSKETAEVRIIPAP